MENGSAKRISLSALAAAAVVGAVSGTFSGTFSETAGYALRTYGGDIRIIRATVAIVASIVNFLSSPLFLILASVAVGAAISAWFDFLSRKWRERWNQSKRLSFSAYDRKLIAMTLMLIFGGGFALSALWAASERAFRTSEIDPPSNNHTKETIVALTDQQKARRRDGIASLSQAINGPLKNAFFEAQKLRADWPKRSKQGLRELAGDVMTAGNTMRPALQNVTEVANSFGDVHDVVDLMRAKPMPDLSQKSQAFAQSLNMLADRGSRPDPVWLNENKYFQLWWGGMEEMGNWITETSAALNKKQLEYDEQERFKKTGVSQ